MRRMFKFEEKIPTSPRNSYEPRERKCLQTTRRITHISKSDRHLSERRGSAYHVRVAINLLSALLD